MKRLFYVLLILMLSCDGKNLINKSYEIRVFDHQNLENYKLRLTGSKIDYSNLLENKKELNCDLQSDKVKKLTGLLNTFRFNREPINIEKSGLDLEGQKVFLHIIISQENKNNIHYEYAFFKDLRGYSKDFKDIYLLIDHLYKECLRKI